MMKTEVNFFYFAGSVVGGVVFLGSSLLGGLFFTETTGGGFFEYLASAWGVVYLLCLSFMIGICLSQLSIRWFYESFIDSPEAVQFRKELSRKIGVEIQRLGRFQEPSARFAAHLAFAHNVGHPNSLYDIAGRARLAGTAFLNALWISALSGALAIREFSTMEPSATGVVLATVSVLSVCSSAALLGLTKRTWIGYSNRLAIFSAFRFADGSLVRSQALDNFLETARSTNEKVIETTDSN